MRGFKGWIKIQNPNRFVEELIEIGQFAKILDTIPKPEKDS